MQVATQSYWDSYSNKSHKLATVCIGFPRKSHTKQTAVLATKGNEQVWFEKEQINLKHFVAFVSVGFVNLHKFVCKLVKF